MKTKIVMKTRKLKRTQILCLKSRALEIGHQLVHKGWAVIDSKPVHRLLAKHYGVVKTCPAGRALDILPDWTIIIAEK